MRSGKSWSRTRRSSTRSRSSASTYESARPRTVSEPSPAAGAQNRSGQADLNEPKAHPQVGGPPGDEPDPLGHDDMQLKSGAGRCHRLVEFEGAVVGGEVEPRWGAPCPPVGRSREAVGQDRLFTSELR